MLPPEAGQTEQVFLSYSRSDREACILLRAALEQAGLSVYRDEDANRVGDRWMSRLEQALEGCSAFVVLVGRDGVRRWVGAEVQVALKRHLSADDEAKRLPIFPVLLEGATPEALPPFLALFQALRWSPPDPVPPELIADIRARASRFGTQPAFEGCPFLGLSAFGRGDARLFFGRRKETLEALACLGDQQQTNPDQVRAAARRTTTLAADRRQQRRGQVIAGQRRDAAHDRAGRAVGAHRLRPLVCPRPDDAGQGPAGEPRGSPRAGIDRRSRRNAIPWDG